MRLFHFLHFEFVLLYLSLMLILQIFGLLFLFLERDPVVIDELLTCLPQFVYLFVLLLD